MHVATVERKISLLTGRDLQQNQNQAQCERPSATTDLGFERTEQRHKENKEALIQEYFLWEGKVNVRKAAAWHSGIHPGTNALACACLCLALRQAQVSFKHQISSHT
ncbi:hypothetical protein GOODEAATRI_022797 [Goodea atripinnis]|uniref:Uncharacterized protein n=1 Tax=Goodea atripinnis TaxID=208336 RepID=A0ABV0PGC6_9TELE